MKSVERKEAGGNSEAKELIADFENIVKHVQDQGQCNSPNIDFENKIKQETLNIEKNICFNPETDKPIIIGEIKSVLKMLKNEKSSGPDGIINEIFKNSSDATIKALAKLFNLILKTGQYPEQWNKSYLILLHKSSKKCDPSNYGGISLINCVANIFSAILNNRLKLLMKDKYSNSQFGFRENHRTSDSLFILKTLINKYLHKNKKKL